MKKERIYFFLLYANSKEVKKMKKPEIKCKPKLEEVVYVSWEESEAGWGTRPNGCSLHLTQEDFEVFERKYWKKMPKDVPHEYSRPVGEPVKMYVRMKLYDQIKSSNHGLRLLSHEEYKATKNKELMYGSERSGWVESK